MPRVLNFHGIGLPPPQVPADEVPYWCPNDVWPRLVGEIAGLAAAGVDFAITFDDGNRSDVEQALPALVDHGLHATFFVCAGRIGAAGYLDGADLRALRAAGMSVGSHGWAHRDLRRAGPADLRRETVDARRRIAEELGTDVEEFAIPFGSYDRRVLEALRGYRRVHTSDGGHARNGNWLVPRTSYVSGWGIGTVRALARPRGHLDFVARQVATFLKRMR